jgi:REP element-mobilizing transposase RayT
LIQGLTFRLYDSVPAAVVENWKRELGWMEHRTTTELDAAHDRQRHELHRRVAAYEDSGAGYCYFNYPAVAQFMEEALHFFHGERYQLMAWCVMPNHVHALISPLEPWTIGKIVQSWKRHTARQANELLNRTGGAFWAPDYNDRFIRDEPHVLWAVNYIHQNPVKAGLCSKAEDWQWSSARRVVRE